MALDAPTPFGLPANDVLELALGSFALPMDWLTPVYGQGGGLFDYAVDGASDVRVEVALRGPEARVIDLGHAGELCGQRVEVDVEVLVESADGALHERFEGSLELGAGMAQLEATLPASAIQGSFAFEPPELDGRAPASLMLQGRFTRHGVDATLSQGYGSGLTATSLRRARWPTWEGRCALDGTLPLRDEGDGLLEAAVQTILGNRGLVLVNLDGESAPAEVSLEPAPNGACFFPAGFDGAIAPGQFDTVSIPAELTLNSRVLAGPVRTRVEMRGFLSPGTELLESVSLSLEQLPCARTSYSPTDFLAQCGDWGVDLGDYEAASLSVYESRFDANGGYAVFEVLGAVMPGCVPSLDGLICDECWSGDFDVVRLGQARLYRPEP